MRRERNKRIEMGIYTNVFYVHITYSFNVNNNSLTSDLLLGVFLYPNHLVSRMWIMVRAGTGEKTPREEHHHQ